MIIKLVQTTSKHIPTIMSVTERLKIKRLLTFCRDLLQSMEPHKRRFPKVARMEKSAILRPRRDRSTSVKCAADIKYL